MTRYTSSTRLPRPLRRASATWAMLVWIFTPLACTLHLHPWDEHGRCATCGHRRHA